MKIIELKDLVGLHTLSGVDKGYAEFESCDGTKGVRNYESMVYYLHNGEQEQLLVETDGDEKQLIHNGMSLAMFYYPDEKVEYLRHEIIDAEDCLFSMTGE